MAVTNHQYEKAGHLRKACKRDHKASGGEQHAQLVAICPVVEEV